MFFRVSNLRYICLYEGVHLRLTIEGKNIFIYCLFTNNCTYISEYYFQNRYMLIGKYIRLVMIKYFLIRNIRGTCSSVEMLQGYLVREKLGTLLC